MANKFTYKGATVMKIFLAMVCAIRNMLVDRLCLPQIATLALFALGVLFVPLYTANFFFEWCNGWVFRFAIQSHDFVTKVPHGFGYTAKFFLRVLAWVGYWLIGFCEDAALIGCVFLVLYLARELHKEYRLCYAHLTNHESTGS